MTATLRALVCGAITPTLLALTLLTAGCASDDAPQSHAGKDAARKPPLPNLAGQETFFGGRILAELKVGAMAGFKVDGEAKGGDSDNEGRSRGHGGGFNPGGMGGGGGGSGAHGGGRHRQGGEESAPAVDPDNTDKQRQMAARRADRMGAPPVMIHLRFTNTGSERVDLVVADFLSPLGNFVITPEKLSLDPGQTVEVEPMTSRLAGEITGGEISLELRLGPRQETKTITLKPEAIPTAPTAAPQT